VQQFTENLSYSPLSHRINWVRYKIKSGDTLVSLSRRFNISPASIRNSNPTLAANLKPGKDIVIPRTTPSISNTILKSQPKFFTASANTPTPVTNNIKKSLSSLAHAFEMPAGKYSLQPGDTLYMVRKGDDLYKVSKHFHLTPEVLMAVNKLSADDYLQPGNKLIIPTHLADNNTSNHYHLSSGDTVYMVRRGENIETIAEKFNISPASIRVANLISDNQVHEGDQLVIPTHVG
jgi:membrane-bound lytic murein transglycosylase D